MTGTQDASAGSPAGDTPVGGPGWARFLIGSANPSLLANLTRWLQDRDGIRLERVLQTQTGVGGVVVNATPQAIAQLKKELGPEVLIEEDRPLDPLTPDDSGSVTPSGPARPDPAIFGEGDPSGGDVVPPGCR
jgi:hypothetical protein